MTTAATIDITSAAFKPHAYEVYAQMRQEAPFTRTTLPDGGTLWIVTRYEDVLAIFKDERFVKDYHNALTPEQLAQMPEEARLFEFINRNMLFSDPPDHTRLRALVSKGFTPRRIEQLRPRIQQIADELLDAVRDQPTWDLIDSYAFPLPIIVISEMLGVPHHDSEQFRAWSNTVVNGDTMLPGDPQRQAALGAFGAYIRNLIATRRAQPGDDLISVLVQSEEQGDTLNENELISMIFLLIVAGHETTVNLIANGMLALLTHPDQMKLLKNDQSLIKNAIEEFLRFDGPVETSTMRFAREEIVVGEQRIGRGDRVLVVINAADRDPAQFDRPDDLDITRQIKGHLAFGHGIHYCLGAPLARMEGQIAISTLLRRLPTLQLAVAPDTLHYRPSMLVRGLERLPVTNKATATSLPGMP